MSSSKRRHGTRVIDVLLEQPQRFGFFQAVRLIERWLDQADASPAPSSMHHRHNGVVDARLRFRNSLSLSFAASEVEALRAVPRESATAGSEALQPFDLKAIDHLELTPAFMGLLGASGTLPLHYTEMIAQRESVQRDDSARAFLDVFTHRAVSLFYAAWKKHRLHVQYEADQHNRFLPLVLALSGLGQRGLRERLAEALGGVPDEAVAYFGGAAQRRNVSAVQLQGVLQTYAGVPVRVDQFVGRWYALPEQSCTRLGMSNGVLGQSAIAGERVWQRDLCLRIVLGPLDRAHYLRFLPGGAGEQALRQWLLLLCGPSFEYEIRLRLRRDAVQGTVLRTDAAGPRLGQDTFLRTTPETQDREDVVYDLDLV